MPYRVARSVLFDISRVEGNAGNGGEALQLSAGEDVDEGIDALKSSGTFRGTSAELVDARAGCLPGKPAAEAGGIWLGWLDCEGLIK